MGLDQVFYKVDKKLYTRESSEELFNKISECCDNLNIKDVIDYVKCKINITKEDRIEFLCNISGVIRKSLKSDVIEDELISIITSEESYIHELCIKDVEDLIERYSEVRDFLKEKQYAMFSKNRELFDSFYNCYEVIPITEAKLSIKNEFLYLSNINYFINFGDGDISPMYNIYRRLKEDNSISYFVDYVINSMSENQENSYNLANFLIDLKDNLSIDIPKDIVDGFIINKESVNILNWENQWEIGKFIRTYKGEVEGDFDTEIISCYLDKSDLEYIICCIKHDMELLSESNVNIEDVYDYDEKIYKYYYNKDLDYKERFKLIDKNSYYNKNKEFREIFDNISPKFKCIQEHQITLVGARNNVIDIPKRLEELEHILNSTDWDSYVIEYSEC